MSSTTSARLNQPQINMPCAKINLSFGAGHVIRKPIHFTLLTATFSHIFLDLLDTARHSNTAGKNRFIVATKSGSLPSFGLLNFSWTSTSLTTHIHICSISGQTHSLLICIFRSHAYTHTYTHTHTHTHIYIYIYVNTTSSLFTLLSWQGTYIHTTLREQFIFHTITKFFKKFRSVYKKLDDQKRSDRPKTINSEAAFWAIKANHTSSTRRVSGEL